ncbi:MAG: class I SAM-dependent methyltransferase [Methanobacteriota archaeon]
MPATIPENSFHFIISCNTFEAGFEEVPKLIPGLFKTLRPGGIALFNLDEMEWWKNRDELKQLDERRNLTLFSRKSGHKAPFDEYLEFLEELRKRDPATLMVLIY